jgi:pyruvate,water dikinase
MTQLMVNLGSPKRALQAAALPVAGVGLLRAEFLFYSLGRHPKSFIDSGSSEELVTVLRRGVTDVAAAFHPRPVRYRSLDFKSNEMRSLADGAQYEVAESNPALGLRGASRYIRDRSIFMAELRALREVRAAGLSNVQLMIPFVRSIAELVFCREAITEAGLDDGLELWAMLEVPALIYMVPELAPYVNGVSVGTNDLTQLMFGVDRDNTAVAQFYDDGHPTIYRAVRSMIADARAAGLKTSICGDRPSRDPAVAKLLIDMGIDSISVTADAVEPTRRVIAEFRHCGVP